ncbi:MAG: hypothetical protein MJZ37_07500 [Bacilli bacterium]|nr:hypothetical protein [Bacilli bacterium]
MEKEIVIAEEIAEKDFTAWCEANEIDCDVNMMSDEEKKDFEPLKKRIVKAIMEGRCEVDDDQLSYTLGNYESDNLTGKVIKIKSPTGKLFLGTDGYKETQSVHKLHGAMSALTGLDVGYFGLMNIKDWKFFQSVLQLFLSI